MTYNQEGVQRLMDAIIRPTKTIPVIPQEVQFSDMPDDFEESTPEGAASMEDQYIAFDLVTTMRHAIDDLPQDDQRIVRGIFYEGKTQAQVAREMGLTERVFGIRYAKIMANLKNDRGIQEYLMDLR